MKKAFTIIELSMVFILLGIIVLMVRNFMLPQSGQMVVNSLRMQMDDAEQTLDNHARYNYSLKSGLDNQNIQYLKGIANDKSICSATPNDITLTFTVQGRTIPVAYLLYPKSFSVKFTQTSTTAVHTQTGYPRNVANVSYTGKPGEKFNMQINSSTIHVVDESIYEYKTLDELKANIKCPISEIVPDELPILKPNQTFTIDLENVLKQGLYWCVDADNTLAPTNKLISYKNSKRILEAQAYGTVLACNKNAVKYSDNLTSRAMGIQDNLTLTINTTGLKQGVYTFKVYASYDPNMLPIELEKFYTVVVEE